MKTRIHVQPAGTCGNTHKTQFTGCGRFHHAGIRKAVTHGHGIKHDVHRTARIVPGRTNASEHISTFRWGKVVSHAPRAQQPPAETVPAQAGGYIEKIAADAAIP